MVGKPELISRKALMLFPTAMEALDWENVLKTKPLVGINALRFCLAFDFKQALTLLEYFQKDKSLKVVLVDSGLLEDPKENGAEEFFKQLEAQSHALLLEIAADTPHWSTHDRVLKHLRKNNPKTIARRKNKAAAAVTGEQF